MAGLIPVAVAVLLAVLAAGSAGVRAAEPTADRDGAVLEVRHPELRAALARIARGSPSWRDAIAAVAAAGRRAVIVTPDEVRILSDRDGAPLRFDAGEVAALAPQPDADGRVSVVVVVVNVEGLEALHERRGSLPVEFHGDLDRVLAHEVYGHAVPYLLAGHLSGRCPDPQAGERAAAACAIQRENVVRAELGLGRRTDRALNSLALARAIR